MKNNFFCNESQRYTSNKRKYILFTELINIFDTHYHERFTFYFLAAHGFATVNLVFTDKHEIRSRQLHDRSIYHGLVQALQNKKCTF